jgi:hypothetical protein
LPIVAEGSAAVRRTRAKGGDPDRHGVRLGGEFSRQVCPLPPTDPPMQRLRGHQGYLLPRQ